MLDLLRMSFRCSFLEFSAKCEVGASLASNLTIPLPKELNSRSKTDGH